jgi:hypothetical protein
MPQRTGNSKQGRQIRKTWENAVWGYESVIIFRRIFTPDHFVRELCRIQRNLILAQKKGIFKILAFNTIKPVTHEALQKIEWVCKPSFVSPRT